MKTWLVSLMLFAATIISLPAAAGEPTVDEVYQVANAGKFDQARHMMEQVLKAHPDSARAHYVDAEILARDGQFRLASDEFARAERLSPGLPFASPHSVSELRGTLFRRPTASFGQMLPLGQAAGVSRFPWPVLFIGLGLVAFIFWASRLMMRRDAPSAGALAAPYQDHYGLHYPPAAANAAPGTVPGSSPVAGSGLGSTVLGGLAGGAALGAGLVAGETVMHRLLDGSRPVPGPGTGDGDFAEPPTASDLGGDDFGIADDGSWDDPAGGNDDWN